jgi:hypothetical protein
MIMHMPVISFSLTLLLSIGLSASTTNASERTSGNQSGSLLMFSRIDLKFSADASALHQDTLINITNEADEDVIVQAYFVNGDEELEEVSASNRGLLLAEYEPGWNTVGCRFTLEAHQSHAWSAANGSSKCQRFTVLDPSGPGRPDPETGSTTRVLRGYVIMFAVTYNGSAWQQMHWNHLTGDASIVNHQHGTMWTYDAAAFQAIQGSHGTPVGLPGAIKLDGVEFEASFDSLWFDFDAAGVQQEGLPLNTVLTLHAPKADLRVNGCGLVQTQVQATIWNEAGSKFTGTRRCICGWDQTFLNDWVRSVAIPNHFLLHFLGSDSGTARLTGMASVECDYETCGPTVTLKRRICEDIPIDTCFDAFDPGAQSESTGLAGLSTTYLNFDPSPGTGVVGDGQKTAVILYNVETLEHPTSGLPDSLQNQAQDMSTGFDELAGGWTDTRRSQEDVFSSSKRYDKRAVSLSTLEMEADHVGPNHPSQPTFRGAMPPLGSLLIYSNIEIRWNGTGQALLEDTILNVTNDGDEGVLVKAYFINGDQELPAIFSQGLVIQHFEPGWNTAGCRFFLGAYESHAWSAAEGSSQCQPFTVLDPQGPGRPDPETAMTTRTLRGYAILHATKYNGSEWQPIHWNHLTGDATIMLYDQDATWGYDARAFQAVQGGPGEYVGSPGTIRLDGIEFEAAHDNLLFDFTSPGGLLDVFVDTALTLHAVSADLRVNGCGPVQTQIEAHIWNDVGSKFTGTRRCVCGWDQVHLSDWVRSRAVPNHFLRHALGTYFGIARLTAIDSVECDYTNCGESATLKRRACAGAPIDTCTSVFNPYGQSEPAALLGLSTQFEWSTLPVGLTTIGASLQGIGQRTAEIRFDRDTVPMPATLRVMPEDSLHVEGMQNGPFFPAKRSYRLLNIGNTDLAWTASHEDLWFELSEAGGTIKGGEQTEIAVFIKQPMAGAITPPGMYEDVLVIANTTNGRGTTSLFLSVDVHPESKPPWLWGDFDGDQLIALDDLAALTEHLAGPDQCPNQDDWHLLDLDFDYDVDLYDFAAFQNRFGESL